MLYRKDGHLSRITNGRSFLVLELY